MAKGMALNIGLNLVDPKHYEGWDGQLTACEADALDMADIAKGKKCQVKTLLTKAATRAAVVAELGKAAKTLKAGDFFLLTYSGHGGQVPDVNGDEENDNEDETWCLYDGQLIDDELYLQFAKFAAGVRILVLSDSCHSGTVTKAAFFQGTPLEGTRRYRNMPASAALRTYRAHRAFYDGLTKDKSLKGAAKKVKASVLLISGCQDNQYSQDGDFNGLFTGTLLRVWKNGSYKRGYRSFHRAIVRRMPPDQTPNFYLVGAADPTFEAQIPFTV